MDEGVCETYGYRRRKSEAYFEAEFEKFLDVLENSDVV